MKLLEPLKQKYPGISYADLYSFAGSVALEEMGDIKLNWRPGRVDLPDGKVEFDWQAPPARRTAACLTPPRAWLTSASSLAGWASMTRRSSHSVVPMHLAAGSILSKNSHTTRSGFDGPWTNAPTMLTNDYFVLLTSSKWHVRKWNGPKQYQDETGQLMMLPTDMALLDDPEFKKWVDIYAKDEDRFKKDFAKAWKKLQENGVKALAKPWYQFW